MAEEHEDPREVPWHPRFAKPIIGHESATVAFRRAFTEGRPHHAWLIHGPEGIGKASWAYAQACWVLEQGAPTEQVRHWVENRAHPDLAVLERSLTDAKPRKLRAEITVDDARAFMDRFGRTASTGGWRAGLVDCMDDLNTEAANALLKLIEEPPRRTVLLLVCHQPGRLLRTLRSRCLKQPFAPLSAAETLKVLSSLPLDAKPPSEELELAASLSHGSPGRALQLLQSPAAKAFAQFRDAKRLDSLTKNAIAAGVSGKNAAQDYPVFMGLLLEWIGLQARARPSSPALALAYSQISEKLAQTEAFNLDRKTAVLDHLSVLDDALKAA